MHYLLEVISLMGIVQSGYLPESTSIRQVKSVANIRSGCSPISYVFVCLFIFVICMCDRNVTLCSKLFNHVAESIVYPSHVLDLFRRAGFVPRLDIILL